jgi:hypothetical protein
MELAFDGDASSWTEALTEISKTLLETILIVGVVVFLFMGSIRTATRAPGRDAGVARRRGGGDARCSASR